MEPEQPEYGYGEAAVDLIMVRWMLDTAPSDRLATLQAFVDAVWARAGRGCRSRHT